MVSHLPASEGEGLDPDADLPWLLAFGLGRFLHDEGEWKAKGGGADSSDPHLLELKRRETEALLVSLRGRTVTAEMHMHVLVERVRALGGALKENRSRMRVLRNESAALERRIASGRALPSFSSPRPNSSPALAARIKRWFRRRREDGG